jgi:hypothetical protein
MGTGNAFQALAGRDPRRGGCAMWDLVLDRMLRDFVRSGRLAMDLPGRGLRHYGDPAAPAVTLRLHDPTLPRRLVLNTELALGEAYMDGSLTIDGDDLDGLLTLATRNAAEADTLWWRRLAQGIRRARRVFDQWNPALPGAGKRGAPLRPLRRALRPLPRCRPAVFLRLFRRPRHDAGGRAGGQETPHRRKAAAGAGDGGLRDRLRLGRHGADAGARLRGPGAGRDAQRGTAEGRDGARAARRACRTGCGSS